MSGDANSKVIDIVDLPVTFEVVAMPTIAPGSLTLSCGAALLGAVLALTLVQSKKRSDVADEAGAPHAMDSAVHAPEQAAA